MRRINSVAERLDYEKKFLFIVIIQTSIICHVYKTTILHFAEKRDMMLLDLLNVIKRKYSTLEFRCFCSKNVYGFNGLNINSKNNLVCMTPLSDLFCNKKDCCFPLL